MSLTRVRFNLAAQQSLFSLLAVNQEVTNRLLRLSTGRRINSVGDDPAGFSVARTLEARRRGLEQALTNVGTAQNVLSIAEGGYLAIGDLLQSIREKALQGADDTFTTTERDAIQDQIDSLVAEVDDIVDDTTFQETKLIDGSFTSKVIQTGASAGDTLVISLLDADSAALTITALSVSDATAASAAVATVDTAITTLNTRAQDAGEFLIRLQSREDQLSVTITQTEAARSRIEDADFAKEQLELIKAQIIQQTAIAALAQANISPQLILALF